MTKKELDEKIKVYNELCVLFCILRRTLKKKGSIKGIKAEKLVTWHGKKLHFHRGYIHDWETLAYKIFIRGERVGRMDVINLYHEREFKK